SSLRIEEGRFGHRHTDIPVGHRHPEAVADALAAVFDKGERDRMAAIFRPVGGGDEANHRDGESLAGDGDDLRALLKHDVRILGSQPDQMAAARRSQIRPLQAAHADEIALVAADHPAEADIAGCYGSVRILANDEIALLGAQDMHRFGSVDTGAYPCGARLDLLPYGAAVICGHIDL